MSFLNKNFGHLVTLAFPQGKSQELQDMQGPTPPPPVFCPTWDVREGAATVPASLRATAPAQLPLVQA